MRRTLLFMSALALLVSVSACKATKERVEAAYKTWDGAMEEAADDAEKVAVAKAFLARFPDTEHTREVAGAAIELLSGPLADPAGADAFVVELMGKATSPETRTALLGMRLGTLAGKNDAAGLRAAVAEYTAGRELEYGDRERVFEAAVQCGEWDLAIAHAEAALPLATPEAFRADNATRKLTEQRVADFGRRRKVGAQAAMGWAFANQGRFDQALPVLTEAADTDFHGYMGNTESAAGSYLGRALAMAGRHDDAERPLAIAALYGGDAPARDALRARFATMHGSADDFDAWLGEARRRMARPVEEFTLADYGGTAHTFSQLRNGEVTLLSFWFPT
jgi:tetratricopeptide (TPR) repeat protein